MSTQIISSGNYYNLSVQSGDVLIVRDSGSVQWTQVSSGGTLSMEAGGYASGTSVLSGGSLHVTEKAVLDNLRISSGCIINGFTATLYNALASATLDTNLSLSNFDVYGSADLYAGQRANDFSISSGGIVTLHSGATGNHFSILSGGIATLHSGATGSDPTVSSGGSLYIQNPKFYQSATKSRTCSGETWICELFYGRNRFQGD